MRKSHNTLRNVAEPSGSPGSVQRLVSLRCQLTQNEQTLLMNLIGMASNDPGDLDHAALTNLREKIRDGLSPGNDIAEPRDRNANDEPR